MDAESALEAIGAIITTVPPEQLGELDKGYLDLRSRTALDAGAVAVNVVASETEKPLDIWTTLTSEQKKRAEESIAEMAEKFNRRTGDFGLLEVTEKDQDGNDVTNIKAILTATKGIDLGDPEKKYDANRNWANTAGKTVQDRTKFSVGLSDGSIVDTRQALSLETLEALAKANPDIYEWVWLVNERADEPNAPIAVVNAGFARRSSSPRDGVNRSVAFRPAVVIN